MSRERLSLISRLSLLVGRCLDTGNPEIADSGTGNPGIVGSESVNPGIARSRTGCFVARSLGKDYPGARCLRTWHLGRCCLGGLGLVVLAWASGLALADLAQVVLALASNLACVAVDLALARVVADPIQAFAAKLDVDLHHLGRGHV